VRSLLEQLRWKMVESWINAVVMGRERPTSKIGNGAFKLSGKLSCS
jgi:hypothetical protein